MQQPDNADTSQATSAQTAQIAKPSDELSSEVQPPALQNEQKEDAATTALSWLHDDPQSFVHIFQQQRPIVKQSVVYSRSSRDQMSPQSVQNVDISQINIEEQLKDVKQLQFVRQHITLLVYFAQMLDQVTLEQSILFALAPKYQAGEIPLPKLNESISRSRQHLAHQALTTSLLDTINKETPFLQSENDVNTVRNWNLKTFQDFCNVCIMTVIFGAPAASLITLNTFVHRVAGKFLTIVPNKSNPDAILTFYGAYSLCAEACIHDKYDTQAAKNACKQFTALWYNQCMSSVEQRVHDTIHENNKIIKIMRDFHTNTDTTMPLAPSDLAQRCTKQHYKLLEKFVANYITPNLELKQSYSNLLQGLFEQPTFHLSQRSGSASSRSSISYQTEMSQDRSFHSRSDVQAHAEVFLDRLEKLITLPILANIQLNSAMLSQTMAPLVIAKEMLDKAANIPSLFAYTADKSKNLYENIAGVLSAYYDQNKDILADMELQLEINNWLKLCEMQPQTLNMYITLYHSDDKYNIPFYMSHSGYQPHTHATSNTTDHSNGKQQPSGPTSGTNTNKQNAKTTTTTHVSTGAPGGDPGKDDNEDDDKKKKENGDNKDKPPSPQAKHPKPALDNEVDESKIDSQYKLLYQQYRDMIPMNGIIQYIANGKFVDIFDKIVNTRVSGWTQYWSHNTSNAYDSKYALRVRFDHEKIIRDMLGEFKFSGRIKQTQNAREKMQVNLLKFFMNKVNILQTECADKPIPENILVSWIVPSLTGEAAKWYKTLRRKNQDPTTITALFNGLFNKFLQGVEFADFKNFVVAKQPTLADIKTHRKDAFLDSEIEIRLYNTIAFVTSTDNRDITQYITTSELYKRTLAILTDTGIWGEMKKCPKIEQYPTDYASALNAIDVTVDWMLYLEKSKKQAKQGAVTMSTTNDSNITTSAGNNINISQGSQKKQYCKRCRTDRHSGYKCYWNPKYKGTRPKWFKFNQDGSIPPRPKRNKDKTGRNPNKPTRPNNDKFKPNKDKYGKQKHGPNQGKPNKGKPNNGRPGRGRKGDQRNYAAEQAVQPPKAPKPQPKQPKGQGKPNKRPGKKKYQPKGQHDQNQVNHVQLVQNEDMIQPANNAFQQWYESMNDNPAL